jgi:hypothetical protein
VTDYEIACAAADLFCDAAAKQERDETAYVPPLVGKIGEMRERLKNYCLVVTEMTGELLEEFIDFEYQFLVEQTGLRATMSRERLRRAA